MTFEELLRIKEEVWRLLGFHPDTPPDYIYDKILDLRHYGRQVPKQICSLCPTVFPNDKVHL